MPTETNEKKRPRGRPSRPAPEPIQDTPENVIKTVMRTRSKAERKHILKKSGPGIEPLLERQPQEPAPSAPSQEPRRKDFEAPEPSRRETPAPAESPGGPPPAESPPGNDNLLLEVYQ